jgi:Ca-activated chloride channel family protein
MLKVFAWIVFSVVVFSRPAFAAPDARVKISAEPVSRVLPSDQAGKAYIQVTISGEAAPTEGARTPVNVALVIDKSGSMQGPKIEQAKEAATVALERLSPQDAIAVVSFNHEVQRLVPGGPVEKYDEMRRRIAGLTADGTTAIFAAVTQGAQELKPFKAPGRFDRVILLSDGQANVGPSTPADLEALGRELGAQGISVTTLGLGLGYNEDLMVRLAAASDGNHTFIEDPDQLVDIFNKEFGDILSVVGQDVEIIIECPEGFKPLRALGRAATVEGNRISFKMNQVYGAQEKYVILEVEYAKDKAQDAADLAAVKASYTDSRSKERVSVNATAQVRFSASQDEVRKSVNPEAMAAVVTQIANERNERAVKLRDEGKVEEAKRELQSNADYLAQQSAAIPGAAAAPLKAASERNRQQAESLEGRDWDKTRKGMRSEQHKAKTQQKY